MTYTPYRLWAAGGPVLALSASALFFTPLSAQADQVILDDLIVDGSACIGQDCANGESFGFDTLRLKENNLRIKFQDTSTTGSFPTNDWQLTANDSGNGGANKFSIDDIDGGRTPFTLEARAPSNSIYVDDGGRVGFGTNNPVVENHIVNGDSPTLRLEQNGSSGFTPQTWDIAGNETNFFVRDVTNGSALSLRVRAGAPAQSLYIAEDGNIGMGTASPDAGLHVTGGSLLVDDGDNGAAAGTLHTRGEGTQLAYFESTNGGAVQIRMRSDSENRRFLATDSDNITRTQIVFQDNAIQLAGTTNSGADLWATISAAGIITQGPSCNPGPCDRTFDPSYFQPMPIQDHAAYMWENQHLWGVGPTSPDQPYNVTEKTAGMLHALEVAHIYIEQLDNRVKELEALISELQ